MVITISCPSCLASFPVDTEKIPVAGVNVRCSSCSEIFRVERPAEAEAELEPQFEEAVPEVTEPEPEVAPSFDEPAAEVEADATDDWVVETEDPMGGTMLSDTPAFDTAPDPDLETSFFTSPAEAEAPAPVAEEEPLPTFDEPAVEEPLPTFDEPAVEEPLAFDEPAVQEPVAEEPLAFDEPVVQEPVAEEPLTVDEPAVQEPVAEEPAAEEEAAAPVTSGFSFGQRDPLEKARRLARVLVSDMIMYNPERHERALANDTLKEDFEEEIEKSWKEYIDQVGEDLAEGSDFWKEALNDVLAKGESIF